MNNPPNGYRPPEFESEIRYQLSRNESRPVVHDLQEQLAGLDSKLVCHYPSHQALQEKLADWIEVDADRLVITAGGDESIDRVMRLSFSGDRNKVVTHCPTFEMIDVYAKNYSGTLASVEWMNGKFPVDALIERIDSDTALVVVTTPNNPTGQVIDIDDILAVNSAAEMAGAKLLVDNAYIEFADQDPTERLLLERNIMIVRTFSKAWGLAGLRVGYLIAPTAEFADEVRNASGPFPVSAISLEMARKSLVDYQPKMRSQLDQIKRFRNLLFALLEKCGGKPIPSQGNFVLAEFDNAQSVWSELAKDGIGVRKFLNNSLLKNNIRLTCPVIPSEYLELVRSLCRIFSLNFETEKAEFGAKWLEPSASSFQSTQAGQADVDQSKLSEWKPDDVESHRRFQLNRETKETTIEIDLNLDGTGKTEIETGIGFLDHMLTALAFHSKMDLVLKCRGDLHVDDHHTAEDCALALGAAIDQALGPRKGIKRFGYAYAPLDEALARTVVDLSGRPWPEVHLKLEREMVGSWACENIVHFFQSLAMSLKCSLHVDVIRGTNDHHRVEAAFKSCAKALQQALARAEGDVPSTKGVL